MRTTLSLDEDVAALLERLRRNRRGSFKGLVNDALRRGLRDMAKPNSAPTRFETASADLGPCLIGNIDDVADVLAIAEGEAFR